MSMGPAEMLQHLCPSAQGGLGKCLIGEVTRDTQAWQLGDQQQQS